MKLPPCFAVVTPYLFVAGADDFIGFLTQGLGGDETGRHLEGGRIANAQIRFGDSTIMVSESSVDFPAMPTSIYLYVEDADAAVARAVAAGAVPIMAVADMPYGDRQGGVRDRHGNLWWLSQRLVDGPY